MTLAASPALNADNAVTLAQDTKLDGFGNTPLQALVDILLPIDSIEVGLGFREQEWIHSSIEVSVA